MSYSNPQRVINKEFGAAVKGAGDIQRSLENTSANIMNIVKKQKKETKQIEENNILKESQLRDKVNEFTKPGAGNMDNSIVGFWDEKIEAYVNNMNMAANGEITNREAMIRNKQIESLIPQFKSGAGIIATNISGLDDAIENGTLSSTGSVSSKIVLDRIKNNGDVQIVEQNGTIYYWAPDRDENGDIIGEFDPKSSNFINGTVMAANPEKQLFNNKADISGLISQGYTKFSQEETGFSEYYKDIAVTNGDIDPRDPTGKTKISGMEDGYEQLIRVPSSDPDAKNKFVNEVESSAYLNNVIGNQDKMLSVWQDEIPDGEADENGQYPPNSLGFYASGGDPTLEINLEEMGYVGPDAMEEWQNSVYGEYPSNATPEQQALIDKNQKAVSKRYMADQMWDQNAITVPKTLKGKRKIVDDPEPAGTPKKKTLYENLTAAQRPQYAGNKIKEQRIKKQLEAIKYGQNGEVDTDTITAYENKGYDFGENPPTTKEEFERIVYEQDGLDDTYFAIKASETGDEVKVVANNTSTGDSIFGTQTN